ncbi:hypothetical protein EVAR_3084_1 [Eumeta japonica]|uniref:Uncharacterized protein n=1 Tax=Eumeta variegata TaxID=151549 RepID=A0A4C1STX3_EUMVA|nr:hypothetical protein EVAR_3084_1 [Eumeta japonica]
MIRYTYAAARRPPPAARAAHQRRVRVLYPRGKRGCDPPGRRWTPPSRNTCDLTEIASALPASSVEIRYLMVEGWSHARNYRAVKGRVPAYGSTTPLPTSEERPPWRPLRPRHPRRS